MCSFLQGFALDFVGEFIFDYWIPIIIFYSAEFLYIKEIVHYFLSLFLIILISSFQMILFIYLTQR